MVSVLLLTQVLVSKGLTGGKCKNFQQLQLNCRTVDEKTYCCLVHESKQSSERDSLAENLLDSAVFLVVHFNVVVVVVILFEISLQNLSATLDPKLGYNSTNKLHLFHILFLSSIIH